MLRRLTQAVLATIVACAWLLAVSLVALADANNWGAPLLLLAPILFLMYAPSLLVIAEPV